MSRLSQTQAFDDIYSDPDYSSQCEKLSPEEQELQDQADQHKLNLILINQELF
jgi:hypothetical protein